MADPAEDAALACFAVAAPGLEQVVAAELRALGIGARATAGGADFAAGARALYEANLHLRTATRVLVRVAEFRAAAFYELEKRARRVAWAEYFAPGRPIAFRVTARASKLYHEGAIEERLLDAAVRAGGVPAPAVSPTAASRSPTRPGPRAPAPAIDASAGAQAGPPAPGPEDEEGEHAQLFVVRVLHDRVTISADSSGAPLHRRRYRQELARAPLRETLAAAMLLAARWEPTRPLVDPLCGSGTIPIEGALLARAIPPGMAAPGLQARAFAFQQWAGFQPSLWEEVLARARERARPLAPAPILAADRDAGAIAATRANAERAGVAGDIDARQQALSALGPPAGPGWLVTNPPYGRRVGESGPLRDLYATLGRIARERLPGWHLALLSADRRLDAQLGIEARELLRTHNGGIPVRLLAAQMEPVRYPE